jgi:hypothetical protein
MSIGINLLVSKFRIVPSQCWRCAPFERATRPKTQSGAPVAAQKGPLFDFIVDASDERRRQQNAKRPSSGGIDRQTEQVG